MLESLSLYNFKCLKGMHTTPFSKGIYSIKGIRDGDYSSSNRTGKTSFLEAIRFAMFKGSASDVVTEGESDMFSELTLNGHSLFFSNSGAKVDGETVLVSQLKAASEALLGVDLRLFECTSGAFSDSIYGFLSLKPREQKDFLLYYFCDSNVNWDEAREYIQEKVRLISEEKKEITQAFERIDGLLKEIDKDFYESKLDSLKYELYTKEQEYNTTKAYSDEVLNEYKALLSRSSYLSGEMSRLETIKDTINLNEKNHKELKVKQKELKSELKKYLTLPGYDYKIKDLEAKITTKEANLNDLKGSISVYEDNNGLCPILKLECPHKNGLNSFYECCKEKEKEFTSVIHTLQENYSSVKEQRKQASLLSSKLNETSNFIASLEEKLDDLKSKDESLVKIVSELKDIQERIKFVESALNAERVESLINSISSLKTNIEKISAILLDYELKLNTLKEHDEHLIEVNNKLNEYLTASKLVAPKGLPHLLLQDVLSTFELYINEFLEYVDMGVIVSGYSELKSLEDYCPTDGTRFNKGDTFCKVCNSIRGKKLDENISIVSKDSGVEWWQESSGGRALISLAVRLALLKMIKEKGASIDFLILDEVFSNLDSRNKIKVMNLIKFAMDTLDLNQVFMVSHDELKDYADYEITIKHENGEVTIE